MSRYPHISYHPSARAVFYLILLGALSLDIVISVQETLRWHSHSSVLRKQFHYAWFSDWWWAFKLTGAKPAKKHSNERANSQTDGETRYSTKPWLKRRSLPLPTDFDYVTSGENVKFVANKRHSLTFVLPLDSLRNINSEAFFRLPSALSKMAS